MPWMISLAVVVLFAFNSTAAAQVDPPAPKARKPNQCLSDEQLKIIKESKERSRPTRAGDQPPPFDPDYFIGKWKVEWDVPDTSLGSGGRIMGNYIIKRLEGCFYEGTLELNSPDGSYSGKLLLAYSPEENYLSWYETDSRGLSLLKVGPIGGDPGGYVTYFWDAAPVAFKGKVVRFSGTTFLASPGSFRYRPRISFDGEDWVSYGNPWFTREDGAAGH